MVNRAVHGEGLDYRWRPLERISPRLVQAVIAAEDARFCSHRGFDMEAIERALRANADGGRLRGGSTISQQTAKNVFLWPGRDWIRKGLEAGYTVLIETFWPKSRIIEVYLNVAEWGPGVYGAEAAAQHWFGKSADALSDREAARLAAILPSPRRYSAGRPGPYVRRRASRIQAAMGTVREDGLARCVQG
jgi:monofunctional biosynthetic peptidoglycan transglycosylase